MRKSAAVVSARGIGDGLLSSVLASNLSRNAYQVTLYSSPLCALAKFFPDIQIKPFPQEQQLHEELQSYERVFSADYSCSASLNFKNHQVLRESCFDKGQTVLQNILIYCVEVLQLQHVEPFPSLAFPELWRHRYFQERVVLHPTSYTEEKNWPARKFLSLAKEIEKRGFSVCFAVSPEERPVWKFVEDFGFSLPIFSSLEDLFFFVYESGFFVGNDSGTGHMASLLSIPTLSLFAKKRYSRLWRPGWGKGFVVTPFVPLPGGRLRQRYWKRFLTVSQVLKTFDALSRASMSLT